MLGISRHFGAKLALLLCLLFLLPINGPTAVFAQEQEIDARLESAEVEGKTGSPTTVIEVETGTVSGPSEPTRPGDADGPGSPGGTDPNGPESPGGTDPNGPGIPGSTGPNGPGNPGGTDPNGPGSPGGANPNGPESPGGTNPNGPGSPGGANPNGPESPGGTNPNGPGSPGGANPNGPGGPGGTNPNGPGGSDGTDPNGPGSPGGANPNGPGDSGSADPNGPGGPQSPESGEPPSTNGGDADDPNATEPGDEDGDRNVPGSNANAPHVDDPNENAPGGGPNDPHASDPDAGNGSGAESKDNRSWWDRFTDWVTSDAVTDTLNKLGRGLAVGIIGAAAVVGVVLLAAAVLGVAISAPVWIAALAVGIIAGVVYSFVAGDSFDFVKGIGVSALAAIATIGILQAGIAGAARAAFEFIRSSGARGLAGLVGRGATSLWSGIKGIAGRGLALGFRGVVSAAVRGTPGFLKSWLFNKSVGFQFVLGMGFLTASHMLEEGALPTPKDLLYMGVESVLAAVVFGKAVDLIKGAVSSKLVQRASHFVFGGLQSIVIDRIKGEKDDWGKAITSAMLSAFIIGPAVQRFFQSRWFYGIRTKIGAGLTTTDIKNRFGDSVTVTVGPKQITNKQLMLILTTKTDQLNRQQREWLQSGVISQRQLAMLQENEKQFEKFIELKSFFMGSLLEQSVNPDNYKQLQPQEPSKGSGKAAPAMK